MKWASKAVVIFFFNSFFITSVTSKWLIPVAMNMQMSVLVARSALTFGNIVIQNCP